MNKLDSIVIVRNQYGGVATIRFSDPAQDKIISSSNKIALYSLIEKHVEKVLNG